MTTMIPIPVLDSPNKNRLSQIISGNSLATIIAKAKEAKANAHNADSDINADCDDDSFVEEQRPVLKREFTFKKKNKGKGKRNTKIK
jgi:hypothetical protein